MFASEQGQPWLEAGVVTMPTPPADVYLAIQTGTLDGFGWSGCDEIVMFGMHEVAPYMIGPAYIDPANIAWLMNQDVWDSMPSDIQAIFKWATWTHDIWAETVRANGESLRRTDGSFTEICFLDQDSVDTLRGYAHDYLIEEVAPRNARCTEAVRILQDYWAETEHAGWHVPNAPRGTGIPGLMP
jgi:TRAP-type mannitol/chloroaromatic compound transport system substrate-binding protein